MTEFLDHALEERIRALVVDERGDWFDVRRRVSARANRRRRLGLAAAALLLVLLLGVPAFGIGERVFELLSVQASEQPVPTLPGQVAVPYIIDRTLYDPGRRPSRLAAPLRAPLLGQDAALAVPSPDREWLAYETWQGGAPRVRLHDLVTGRETPLELGTQSAAWRRDGALAYWQASGPYTQRGGYVGDVLVRSFATGRPSVWLDRPGPYVVSGWAGNRLLVTIERCPACPRTLAPGVVALAGPGAMRRLELTDVSAISPTGRYVLGGFSPVPGQDSPSPLVRVIDVLTSRVVATFDLRRGAGQSVPAGWLAGGIGRGSWLGSRIVATTALGNVGALTVISFSGNQLSVERVIRLDRTARLPAGYGPFFSAPLFIDRTGERVAVAVSVPPRGGGAGSRSLLECDLSTAGCMRGRPLARGSWLALVDDPSRPRP